MRAELKARIDEAEAAEKIKNFKLNKLGALKAMGVVLLIFFCLGLLLGACGLGVMVPIALFDLATGR